MATCNQDLIKPLILSLYKSFAKKKDTNFLLCESDVFLYYMSPHLVDKIQAFYFLESSQLNFNRKIYEFYLVKAGRRDGIIQQLVIKLLNTSKAERAHEFVDLAKEIAPDHEDKVVYEVFVWSGERGQPDIYRPYYDHTAISSIPYRVLIGYTIRQNRVNDFWWLVGRADLEDLKFYKDVTKWEECQSMFYLTIKMCLEYLEGLPAVLRPKRRKDVPVLMK